MKKNVIALIVFVVLSGIAIWLITRQSQSTIKEDLRDFAVNDTAAITKIFLADREGNIVELKRQSNGTWLVNGEHPARKDAVKLLLSTIKTIDVKSPVSKAEFENVVKQMATNATKVEIYMGGDKPAKVYYVGQSTKDTFGTYMMLENSSTPFVMEIPGFNGYLTTRYFTDPEAWRSAQIFASIPREIESIEVKHADPSRSFKIEGISAGNPEITLLSNNQKLQSFDTAAVYDYASLFHNVHGEYFVTHLLRETKKDSIFNQNLFTINVKETNGELTTLKGYRNQLAEPTLNVEGDTLLFDIDRLYGIKNESDDIMVIQYFVFDPLTPRYESFLSGPVVKN